MEYLATLTLDYNTPYDGNRLTQLWNALEQCGWEYAETSAMFIQTAHFKEIELALEVLAKAVGAPGEISAVALQVQLVGAGRRPPGHTSHRRARDRVMALPTPSERP